jgi:hypothetical protein
MAVNPENYSTGDGSTTSFNLTFEYLDESDVKVSIDGVVKTQDTDYSFANATTILFTSAPANGEEIRIYRDTNVDDLKSTFFAGSSIRAQDLNKNFEQNNFAVQEIKAYTWDNETATIHSDETWSSVDTQIATTAAMDGRFVDQVNDETIAGVKTFSSSPIVPTTPSGDTAATNKSYVDTEINDKINDAIENDILIDSTGLTKSASGGQVTLGIGANSVDFDRIKNDDIITQAEQDAGSPAPADTNIFTASAAARRFDTFVQTATPSGSDWETGKMWFQNDADKTVSIWDGDSWEAITSGGAFTRLDQVIYVDATNGNDDNNGHRISSPKRTIGAALDDINADDTFGDGSVIIVAPGVYQETAPLDIERNNVSIIGQALRSTVIHPTEATQFNSLFRVNSGSYLCNLTFMGMKAGGTRGHEDSIDPDATYGLPETQGWNISFFPDATIVKSPYIQNCTNFSDSELENDDLRPFNPRGGAAGDTDSVMTGGGLLVDGSVVHDDSPLRSMVADSYTHVGLDGPGILVTNNGYVQVTSSYAFFNHYHIKCRNGGQANLAASTTDFGRYSLIADGRSSSAIFTATTTAEATDLSTTFTIGAPTAGANWHGTATRPQDNMLVDIGGNTYPVLSAVANGDGWDVTILRPNTNDRTENLGLDGTVASGSTVSFFLRSMIASSGHTMEYVGSGTNYSALPENGGVPNDDNQIVELLNGAVVNNTTTFGGKVWTAITDHNGTFKVGNTFTVDQQTGFVTIPAGALSVSTLLENLNLNGYNIVDNTGDVNINDQLDMNSNKIVNVIDPTADQDAATKKYVDDQVGTLNLISADIQTLADIEDGTDATDAIQTVAGIADEVVIVANSNTEVTTLAGLDTEITEIYNNLDEITYLGAQASDPSFDIFGNPIAAGDFYFNTTLSQARIYNGITFQSFAENGLVNQSFANETFSAVYTAAAGSNTIDLGNLSVPSGAFGDENATAVRMSLAAGADTFDLGSLV